MITIEGATHIDIAEQLAADDIKSVMKVVNNGLDRRKVRDTFQNDTSSRSHLIFNVYYTKVLTRTRNGNRYEHRQTFVDLAGQERVSRISREPKLYKEAIFINESLLCLCRNF